MTNHDHMHLSAAAIGSQRASARPLPALLAAALMVWLLIAGLVPITADAAVNTNNEKLVKVWTVNFGDLQEAGADKWDRLFARMNLHHYKPDVFLVHEVPILKADALVKHMNEKLDATYKYQHSNIEGDGISKSYSMVIFRTPRFVLPAGEPVLRPLQYLLKDGDCKIVTDALFEDQSRQYLVVPLVDGVTDRLLVAAAAYWNPNSAKECNAKNVSKLDTKLEANWPKRPMTIMGGDFNSHPQTAPREDFLTGPETNPDCWYRTMFFDYPNTRTGETTACPFYNNDSAPDHYYDTVYLAHPPLASPELERPTICHQWTHSHHGFSGVGNSCSDNNNDDDRDRSRIDQIWVRWEFPGGGVKEFPINEARGMMVTDRLMGPNGADQVPVDTYSDHRAVHALIRWCPEASSTCGP